MDMNGGLSLKVYLGDFYEKINKIKKRTINETN